ncbi:hypothetical protein, partial [Methylacidiphilum caldifontis]
HALDPLAQMKALDQLKQDSAALRGNDAEAVKTFAKLTGVRVDDLGNEDVQRQIKQNLDVKRWGGNLRYGDPRTLQESETMPLANAAVRSIDPERLALTFGAPPARVARYMHEAGKAFEAINRPPTPGDDGLPPRPR